MPADAAQSPMQEARDAQSTLDEAMRAERELHIRHPIWYWATLVGPLLVWAVLFALVLIRWGPLWVVKLGGLIALIESVAGRFIILVGTQPGSAFESVFLSPVQLFVLVTLVDATICAYACFHTGFVYRLPRIGPALMRYRLWVRDRVLASTWARQSAVLTVLAYTAAPLWFTGAALGSLLAMALGMSRPAAFVTVMTGMTLGNALMLLAADLIASMPALQEINPWWLVVVVCLMVATTSAAIFGLSRWRSRSRPAAAVEGSCHTPAKGVAADSSPSTPAASAPPAQASDAPSTIGQTTPKQPG
jgi:uncharacterized membrane protein